MGSNAVKGNVYLTVDITITLIKTSATHNGRSNSKTSFFNCKMKWATNGR